MSANKLCFYHNADLDGLCSAAIVKKFVDDVDFYGINYGDEFPWKMIDNYDEIIFVDWTLQPFDDMIKISKMKPITVIDHHKSVYEEYELRQDEIRFMGWFRQGKAACEMCWEYFAIAGYEHLPHPVWLLGRYDVWDLSASPEIMPFQYGMRASVNSYDDLLWEQLFSDDGLHKEIVSKGAAILEYQARQDKKYGELFAQETEFAGHKAIAINQGQTSSQLFENRFDDFPLWITYVRLPSNKWTVSLYSKQIDTSVISKKHGGGGHAGASGFQCDELPFKI